MHWFCEVVHTFYSAIYSFYSNKLDRCCSDVHAGTVGFPFNSVKTMIAKADATAPHGYVDVTKEMADDNSGVYTSIQYIV